MDDTQQTTQPTDVTQPAAYAATPASMGDVAGMTPPPAPVMPTAAPMDAPMVAATPAEPAMPVAEPTAPEGGEEDYSTAEDVLNEVLDSLDRIEAKLETIEKKLG